jgi:hypothetical protein
MIIANVMECDKYTADFCCERQWRVNQRGYESSKQHTLRSACIFFVSLLIFETLYSPNAIALKSLNTFTHLLNSRTEARGVI